MPLLTLSAPVPLWERFLVDGLDAEACGAFPVVTRWQRARALGAPWEGAPVEGPRLDGAALAERRARLEPVWHEARELLEGFAAEPVSRGWVLLLTDREGVILASRGGDAFRGEAARVSLVEGARWDEASRGINAIGTALAERAPVAVVGAAHSVQRHHGLVCYAAPVHDAFGEVVAALDLTGPREAEDPMALLAVASAARAVEASLRARTWARVAADTRASLEGLLEHGELPTLLLEPPGRVRGANPSARALLGGAVPAGPGAPAAPLPGVLPGLSWEALTEAALTGRTHEVALRAGPGGAVRVVRAHAEPVADATGRALALLVRLEPARAPSPRRPPAVVEEAAWGGLLGDDPALVGTRARAARFAPTPLPILLLAETGTGKELLARAIHAASTFAAGPFVPINCGAVPVGLLESELFGHASGAFTGARPGGYEGKLGAAEGGTLFLDELAEMPPALQVLLLRVLEDGTYSRVGETRQRRARFRLVCATCRDLAAQVRAGHFREDLYYRLQGVQLTLPPLRERSDLAELAAGLLQQLAAELGVPVPALSPAALARLQAHRWPGNVRELKTVLRQALVLADGAAVLTPEALPPELGGGLAGGPAGSAEPPAAPPHSLRAVEAQAVSEALAACGGNVALAARQLGVARSTLYRMMERLGLRAPRG